MRLSVKDLCFCALMASILAVSSWICIPAPVPFTMQTWAVFMSVGLLGGYRGGLTVGVYILLGTIGLPVFAGFTGGFGVLFGPLGGYILGFLVMSMVIGALQHFFKSNLWMLALSMMFGLFIFYCIGTGWYVLYYARSGEFVALSLALTTCVVPFVVPDLLKLVLALSIVQRFKMRQPHFF